MKLIIAGMGPGDPGLVTLAALRAADRADLVLAPCPRDGAPSAAGEVLRAHRPDLVLTPITFPMTRDAAARDAALRGQVEALRPQWEGAGAVLLPVIGDSALYATGAWLFQVWRRMTRGLELELIPGVSAHSLAAARAGRFLAMGDQPFTILPGTAEPERIRRALEASDAAALYKPSALGGELRAIVMGAGPWGETVRVDRAGMADERILRGPEALEAPEPYLSTLLLWRGSEGAVGEAD